MTNFERIKNMTVEEMADFLKGIKSGTDLAYGEYVHFDYTIFSNTGQIIDWLQGEVDNGN